jgi:paraquat-inducible protein B
MTRKVNTTQIGIFVLGAIALAVAAVLVLGSGRLFEDHHECLLYFDSSVNGLRNGAPVKYKGVEVGRVRSVRLPVMSRAGDLPVEVVIELDESQMDEDEMLETLAERAIDRGLRAQLEADSFVTGVLFVSLVFAPDTPVSLRRLRLDLPELPTIPTPMQRLQDAAAQMIAQFERIDLASVVRDLGAVTTSLRELAESEEIRSTLTDVQTLARELSRATTGLDVKLQTAVDSVSKISTRFDSAGARFEEGVGEAQQSLAAARKLIENVDERSVPLLDSLRASAESLNRVTLALETGVAKANLMLDPDAPMAVQLHNALVELQGAARATRELIELLERNPAALVRGKATGGD